MAFGFNPLGFLQGLPLINTLFDDKSEEAGLRSALQDVQAQYQAYRPINAEAQMNALRQAATMFNPVNAVLRRLYGPQSQVDIAGALSVNPLAAAQQAAEAAEIARKNAELAKGRTEPLPGLRDA